MIMATKVYIEEGKKKVFAVSLQWSGWARSGKDEESALDALAEYAPRYEVIAKAAGLRLPKSATRLEVVEKLAGNASTDFGMPAVFATSDTGKPGPKEAEKLAALLRAAWTAFDERRATAPAELTKGPRGGGRDRDKIVAHVINAEAGYIRQLGLKASTAGQEVPRPSWREAVLAALRQARESGPLRDRGWPPRYAARRIAWHVLDHAWEIQDRDES